MPVSVHPSAIVEDGAQIGADCVIHAGAVIRRGVVLEDRVVVHPYAVIGGDPQDLRFDPRTPSGVHVGAGTVLREYVTINRATKPDTVTRVGENCFLMTGAHLAHDVQIGRQVILANNVLLAGHVRVGDNTFFGGGAAVHQFCRIGEGAMVAGLARITLDIAPFIMVAERDDVIGLNLVGLKRRGLTRTTIAELKDLFREVYFTAGNIRDVAAAVAARPTETRSTEATRFLDFFAAGKRGFARPRRAEATDEDENNG